MTNDLNKAGLTSPLDEKGLEAAVSAYLTKDGWTFSERDLREGTHRSRVELIVSTYLSATPAPDGMEKIYRYTIHHDEDDPTSFHGMELAHDGEWVRASQAQSALAAMRVRAEAAEEAENEAKDCFWAVYPTYCEVTGHGISTEAARTDLAARAEAAEAQVKRLTEDNEALRRKLDMHEAALSFVHRWAIQKEGNGTSAEERLSTIAHHPGIATLNSREKAE